MTDAQVHCSLRAEAATFWHRLPDAMEMGDLVSEGWLAYQAALPRATGFPHTFAMRRARGAMMDAMRRWRGVRGRHHTEGLRVEPLDAAAHQVAVVMPDLPDADRAFTALERLPSRERECVCRVVVGGESCEEVAQSLGLATQTVRCARSMGLRRLREYLQDGVPVALNRNAAAQRRYDAKRRRVAA